MSDEDEAWQQLCQALDIWAEFHTCENEVPYIVRVSPNQVDAGCFNCGAQPPILSEWHNSHVIAVIEENRENEE